MREEKTLPETFQLYRIVSVPTEIPHIDYCRIAFVISDNASETCCAWISLRSSIKIEFEGILRRGGPQPLVVIGFGGIAHWRSRVKLKSPVVPDRFFICQSWEVTSVPGVQI